MYNFTEIEKKWQQKWEEKQCFKAFNDSDKPKYYYLVEFPYPSGDGLHVGHARSYSALDAMARKKRMQGFNVLYPMGWDSFGLPAEQYAIKNNIHPKEAIVRQIKVFKKQIKDLGISFDWSREFSTTDPEYYKWTQWQFLKFYEHGMAYKGKANINWCSSCNVGLANEEASGGVCERCGNEVEEKEKVQWILKMTEYAEKLLDGLKDPVTDFQNRVVKGQENWIGKSEGAEILFSIKETGEKLNVFTTRPDTIYGATFMVVSPEHPMLKRSKDIIKNYDEIHDYMHMASKKSSIERSDATRDKTGIRVEGLKAINPLSEREIEIWVSDYVLMNYGTGAIMAVPAHDARDYEFAKKFNIDIVEVIKGGDISKEAYVGEGEVVNSKIINGIKSKEEAINKVIKHLEENNIGKRDVNYKLADWVFSRQRFWGEPIPIIHCDQCGSVPVPFEDLPVVLPDVVNYKPTETGESPLANIDEWVNTTCPNCSMPAKRETDTMPNWAGSSWYYLRYMDPSNDEEFVSKEAMKYWGMVDYYNGGMEHTARHLLYARFWHRFLYDIGEVPHYEPFKRRVSHGMILGSNNEKMSKSKGNVVNPDDMIREYGADALRCYELFIGEYTKDVSWSEQSLNGCKKFLDRVYAMRSKVINNYEYTKDLEVIINKTIKKVTEDIDNMKYNTAVSALMILSNEFDKKEKITKGDYITLIKLLNPIAPHITEEINEKMSLTDEMLVYSKWPEYDDAKTVEDKVTIVVQVNGKVRGKFEVSVDEDDEIVKEEALKIDNVKKHIEEKEIKKIIVIPNKLVSIVVK